MCARDMGRPRARPPARPRGPAREPRAACARRAQTSGARARRLQTARPRAVQTRARRTATRPPHAVAGASREYTIAIYRVQRVLWAEYLAGWGGWDDSLDRPMNAPRHRSGQTASKTLSLRVSVCQSQTADEAGFVTPPPSLWPRQSRRS